MSEHRGSSWDFGDVEQEAARLVGAARQWLQTQWPPPAGAEQDADVWGELTDDPAAGADQQAQPCTECPWCRAKAAAGGSRPGADALEGLADVLGAVAESLRAMAAGRRGPAQPS